jgi:tetratricopeptide (TPR) repeat protein
MRRNTKHLIHLPVATTLIAGMLLAGCSGRGRPPEAIPGTPGTPPPASSNADATPAPPSVTDVPTAMPSPTPTATATPGPGLDELLQTPVAMYTNAQLDEAAAAYDALATLYPQRAEPWLGQAAIAQRNGDPAAALGYLQQAVEAQPASFEAWRQLAVLYERDGDYAQVAGAYARMVELVPDDADLYVGRAMALARLGEVEPAVEAMQQAQRIDPYREYAWLNVAGAAYGSRAYDTARELAGAGLEAYPDSVSLLVVRGQAALADGDAGAALADFQAAAASDENSFLAQRWLGEALAALGRDEDAIAAFQRAGDLGVAAGAGGVTSGYEAMAQAARLMARTNPTAAFEYLADKVIVYGQPPPLTYGYALIDLERGNPAAALERLTSLVETHAYAPAYLTRARIYADEGSNANAIRDLEAYLAVREAGPQAEAARDLLTSLGGDPDALTGN